MPRQIFLEQDTSPLAATPYMGPALVGQLERLPKWLNLVPMVAQWLWLALRHGAFMLPGAANPAITAGGLVGEGKSEYFRIMGRHARSVTADYAIIRNGPDCSVLECEAAMRQSDLEYPLIAKPDIGWCGFGVRLVSNPAQLEAYLRQFPRGETIVLQRFIPYEGEAGLYYVRDPGAQKGRIVGVLLRSFPRVVGDGRRTIGALIAAHPRAHRLGRDGRSQPCCDPDMVPGPGEIVRVSITGSTRVGGLYSDASALVTPALEAAIDTIARDMTQIHVARFDIRYETLGTLREGKAFSIIEVNGAGSEAVQAWDPGYSLFEAYRIVFAKQRMLFRIGSLMRRQGHQPPSLITLARLYARQARLIARYPKSN